LWWWFTRQGQAWSVTVAHLITEILVLSLIVSRA